MRYLTFTRYFWMHLANRKAITKIKSYKRRKYDVPLCLFKKAHQCRCYWKKGLENCRTTIKTLIKRNGDLCHIRNCLYRDVLLSWFGIIFIYLSKKEDNGVVANIKPVYFVWILMNNLLILFHVLNVTRGHISRVRKYIFHTYKTKHDLLRV